MRILMVTEDYLGGRFGGIPRVVAESSKRLVAQGDKVLVLTPRIPSSLPARETIEGVDVVRFSCFGRSGPAKFLSTYFATRVHTSRLYREAGIDVVNVHFYLPALGVVDAHATRGSRLLSTFHGPAHAEFLEERGERPSLSDNWQARFIRKLQQRILRKSQAVVVFSDYMRGQAAALLPKRMLGFIRVIPPGVDCESFKPAADIRSARATLGLPADGVVLLSVRRLIRRNGLDVLIDAMPYVLQQHPDCTLVIVGAGHMRSELERQVKELKLETRVIFAGFVSDDLLPIYYSAANLSVIPTRSLEGFGLPILESLACGTPVIGSRAGAIPEIISQISEDLLLPADLAVADVASTICDIIDKHGGDADIRRKCREHVCAHYSWERSAALLRQICIGELSCVAQNAGHCSQP